MLTLKREVAKWADVARAYKVLIDGAEVGEISNGETKQFELSEGSHSLQLKIDWCSSQEKRFEIKNGETIMATCAPAKKPFIIGVFIYTFFKKDRYIDLKILK